MSFKKIISIILIVAIFGFLFTNILKNWDSIRTYPWQVSPLRIFIMIIFLVPVYLINGFSWFLVNKSMGSKLTYPQALRILMLGNFSRFIPGGIWQYAGRIYLAKKIGITSSSTTVAILTETVLTLATGLVVILVVGAFWTLHIESKSLFIIFSLILVLVFLIFLSGNKRLIDLLPIKLKAIKIPIKWLPVLLISYSMQFLLDGTVLFLLANMAVTLPWQIFPVFIGIFAMSWLLGFITIFAPSGLGVQEVSMAALLSNYMQFPIAMVVAIAFRILLIASEMSLVSLILVSKKFD